MKRPGDEMIVPDGWGFASTLDRRDFLKLTGTGLLVMIAFEPLAAWAQEEERPRGYPTDLNAYLHVGADGKVTCLVGKIEMGQGVMTSLPQLVAEELDVSLADVEIVMGDTDLCPWDMGTFGSLSIRHFGPVLRAAAAEAKAVLLQLAAEQLKVPVAGLVVEAGAVVAKSDPKKRVTYGQLTQGKHITRKLDGKVVLEAPKAFTIVGTSAPRRDAVDKVTGRARYSGDLAPAGALHACLLRPPAHGASLTAADTRAAEKVPGVRVVHEGDLVAVLHERRDVAEQALRLVKATFRPSPSTLDDRSIFEHLLKTAPEGEVEASGGDLSEGKKLATRVFEETWRKGYVAHAAMETHSALASVEDGKVTVWASTQTPFPLKSQVQHALKLPADKVRVITPYVGGGFGGKSASQQALEAARLAVATGKPVRVVWSREEEFFFDTFDPAAVISVRSGLDASNRIVLWDYEVVAAGSRGAAHFYDIPHHRTRVRGGWSGNPPDLHPFAVGPWRAPGANANAFARESQLDVMAAKAGVDPVELRLKNLTDAAHAPPARGGDETVRLDAQARPQRPRLRRRPQHRRRHLQRHHGRGEGGQGERQGPGGARGHRPGHGGGGEPRGRQAAGRGRDDDGPRLRARRRGALQERRAHRHQLRQLPPSPLLLGAEARDGAAQLARPARPGRRRAGDRADRRGAGQRGVRRDRRARAPAAAHPRAGEGGDRQRLKPPRRAAPCEPG